jgi:hypothetical protein
MMVMFATTCDCPVNRRDRTVTDVVFMKVEPCGRRSPEYDQWPRCRECQDHVCPDHMRPNTFTDWDEDHHADCICALCPPEAENQLLEGEIWEEYTEVEQRCKGCMGPCGRCHEGDPSNG